MAYCAMPNPLCTDMPCPADQMLQIPQAYQQVWGSPANSVSPVTPAQSMMLFLPSTPVNPMAQVNQLDMLPLQRSYSRSNSGGSPSEVLLTPSSEVSQRSSKGPISKLQEFVQSSKAHPLPSSCAVLQWSHENRMAGSSLQFRATTAFLLDGVPHHILGGWWPSKKQAQRDAAERALSFFVGVCGQEVVNNGASSANQKEPLEAGVIEGSDKNSPDEVRRLEKFVDGPVKWNCRWQAQDQDSALEALCRATVELSFLGVPHVFAGRPCSSKAAAMADTSKRVLWYLQCPGFESAFEINQDEVKSMAQAIPEPAPGAWPPSQDAPGSPSTIAPSSDNEADMSPGSVGGSPTPQANQAELLERKTTVMRLQNKLQKIFTKQLTPGKSVWCWRYEKNEEDGTFRASVHIPLLDKTFSGSWAATHQSAQMEACTKLCDFLEKDYKK